MADAQTMLKLAQRLRQSADHDRIQELKMVTRRIATQLERCSAVTSADLKVRSALERCRAVLGNMALENETGLKSIFDRWPISHEPLRADAKGLLPVIDEALAALAASSPADTVKQPEKVR